VLVLRDEEREVSVQVRDGQVVGVGSVGRQVALKELNERSSSHWLEDTNSSALSIPPRKGSVPPSSCDCSSTFQSNPDISARLRANPQWRRLCGLLSES
jgi:hypothetical protein